MYTIAGNDITMENFYELTEELIKDIIKSVGKRMVFLPLFKSALMLKNINFGTVSISVLQCKKNTCTFLKYHLFQINVENISSSEKLDDSIDESAANSAVNNFDKSTVMHLS